VVELGERENDAEKIRQLQKYLETERTGLTGERKMLLQARDRGAQREKEWCGELELARKTVLDLEQHVQRLEAQLEDEMHRKQREQAQLAREEEEWQENRKREQVANAMDAQAIKALMSQVQQHEKAVADLAHTKSSSMLSPKSIGLLKPADATQNKAKDLESKLAVRRQWENEDPRQHGGSSTKDSIGSTAAAYNAQGMLSAVVLHAGNCHDTRTASKAADSL
jgi:hypothetical protein